MSRKESETKGNELTGDTWKARARKGKARQGKTRKGKGKEGKGREGEKRSEIHCNLSGVLAERRTSQRSKGKGSISGVCASNSHRGQRSPSGAKMASRPPPLPRPKKATAHCEHVTFTTWPKWLPKVSISAWAPLTASVVRKVHMGLKRLHDPPPGPWPK